MRHPRAPSEGGIRLPLHLPSVPRPVPYWARLIPPGELPRRAVVVRLVLAVVLATGLWVIVSNSRDPVDTMVFHALSAPVKNPPGYYPSRQPPPVTVVVRGLRSDVKDMPPPMVSVDLRTTAPTAKGPFAVRVSVPDGVEVLRVIPSTVNLMLQPQARKTVPVLVQPFAAPPSGYVVSAPVVTPNKVDITGPSHTVNAVTNALVTVDESNLRGDQILVRAPTVYDRNGHAVSRHVVLIRPSTVTITLHVSLQRYPQLVPVIPDIRGAVAAGYTIGRVSVSPALVSVESSTPGRVTSLMTVPIAVTGWNARETVQAPLVVPTGLTLKHLPPETVTIDVIPVHGSASSTAAVVVVGKRPGTTVSVSPSVLDVVYQGPVPLLDKPPAPLAVLNVQGRPPGVYHLTASIVLARGLGTIAVSPQQVRVIITAPPRPTATAPATATARPTATQTARPSPTAAPPLKRHAPATPAPKTTTRLATLPQTIRFAR